MESSISQEPSLPYGIGWRLDEDDLFEQDAPYWTEEPSLSAIEFICKQHLQTEDLTVDSFSSGNGNKLYLITTESKSNTTSTDISKKYLFRIPLPMDPFYKTASEVATLEYLNKHTSHTTLPVPEIIAYDCSADHELGFEWILMQMMPGVALSTVWEEIPFEGKESIVKQLAGYARELREKCQFAAIGSLYKRKDLGEDDLRVSVDTNDEEFVLGPVVSLFFSIGQRKTAMKRDRGPFADDESFMKASCGIVIEDARLALENAPGESDAGSNSDADSDDWLDTKASDILEVTHDLLELASTIFSRPEPTESQQPASYKLEHYDLSSPNILINPESNTITGIVDWESITTRPDWLHSYPRLLHGGLDYKQPPEPCVESSGPERESWERSWKDWERAELRRLFFKTAGFEDSRKEEETLRKVQFDQQLQTVVFLPGRVDAWVEHVKEGKPASWWLYT
ncbi:hypothetical protein BJ508DRAFT_241988 [Ascobolus immersus RN42]|uniref:Aminoglycoside phosphotransferase domain-containing protein n=1 Tax=Ascobolus immersus RN42 TaxID=1160509 RepID=A0A3N4I6E8_ASCIM|nr:hypothetical protein BJ508DRAFT_241988 [Ascobolus immersus RN42]